MAPLRFLADVHLGKLARWLRLLGQDAAYQHDHSFEDLKTIAENENRILLSKNEAWLKQPQIQSLIIKGEDSYLQLKQVVEAFHLQNSFRPFTRCINCNGVLIPVSKEQIIDQLEVNTAKYYSEFWQCNSCKKIYWKGSHYERMKNWIGDLKL